MPDIRLPICPDMQRIDLSSNFEPAETSRQPSGRRSFYWPLSHFVSMRWVAAQHEEEQ
jgi:hypothetical protein